MKRLIARLSEKNYTSEQWTALNPILEAGEIGIDLTTNRLKIGDGVKSWNNLPYMSNTSEILRAGDGVKISGNQISTILTYENSDE